MRSIWKCFSVCQGLDHRLFSRPVTISAITLNINPSYPPFNQGTLGRGTDLNCWGDHLQVRHVDV